VKSRPIQDLACITQSTLLNVCLSEDDLRALGVWSDAPNGAGFSPSVWCRAILHKSCHRDAACARRVADMLDLHFLDTVVHVRAMEVSEVERTVRLWIERPRGEALPGLLWALCTDGRDEVHALGVRLCHEAVAVACRTLVVASDEEGASSLDVTARRGDA